MSYTLNRRVLGAILFTIVLSILLFSMSWSVVSQTEPPHVPRPYLVADINPGPDTSYPDYLTAGSETLYAFASDAEKRGMWATDGSEAGTQFLTETFPGSPYTYAPLYGTPIAQYGAPTTIGDNLYYVDNDEVAGDELWVSDGSPTGTRKIKEIANGTSTFPGYYLGNLTPLNESELLFRSYDDVNGSELWITDGTITNTRILTDIVPGPDSAWPYSLIHVNDLVYFRANDAVLGDALWRTDGTAEGTEFAVDLPEENYGGFLLGLSQVDGLLFFANYDATNGVEYWRSDGTPAGTWLLKDIAPGSSGSFFYDESTSIGFEGNFYFMASNLGDNGVELWRSDGSQENTILFKDINPGAGSSRPAWFEVVNGRLFFTADDGVNGRELWISDGTEVGTNMVLDINPSGDGIVINTLYNFYIPAKATLNDLYFFTADDGVHGTELWQSDGTAVGTVMVMDISPGPASSHPGNLTVLGNTLYFVAEDGVHGREIWALSHTAIAEDDLVVTKMAQPVTIIFLENDNYLDPDQLEITVTAQPQFGSVVLNGFSFIYTPDFGYIGPDSFIYTLSDSISEPESATIYIDVEGDALYLPFALQSSVLDEP